MPIYLHQTVSGPEPATPLLVHLNKPGHFAIIDLDEDRTAELVLHSVAEADQLIVAAVEAKRLLLGETEAPPPFQAEPAQDGWYMTEPCTEQHTDGFLCTEPAGHNGGHAAAWRRELVGAWMDLKPAGYRAPVTDVPAARLAEHTPQGSL